MNFINFILKDAIIQFPMNRKVFQKIPESKDDIYNSLFNHHKYYVKSKVHLENFQSFLKYWEDGTFPKIENENIMEFYQLYIEFGFLDEYFTSPKFKKPLFNLSYLIDSEKNGSSLRADIEKEIAQNLDDYIDNFSNDLQKVSITSLYNIFGHPNRNLKNQDKAYQFVTKASENQNKNFFILLDTFDLHKFNDAEIKRDFLFNRKDHFGFIPQNTESFIISIFEENKTLKSKINECLSQNNNLQQQNNDLSIQIKDLQQQNNDYSIQIKKLQQQNDDYASKMQNIRSQMNNIKDISSGFIYL